MDDNGLILFLKGMAVFTLILLNGFFVAAEFAFVKLRDTQLEPLILKGHRRASIARRIIHNVEQCLSATQLGITLCGMGLGALVYPVYEALLAPVFLLLEVHSEVTRRTTAIIFGFVISTVLLIVIGELVPKALAIRKTLPTALAVAKPLEWFFKLTYPFIWTLNHLANWFLLQLGIQPVPHGAAHSEEEIRLLVSSAQQQAGATKLGRDIVLNALELRRRVVREVMRPRQEITVLNTEATMEECLEVADKTRFSRFPLCEHGDLDRTIGVIHIKDLYAMRKRVATARGLIPVSKKIIYLPPTARLERLLALFLDRKLHMAVVVDEYGGTIGMITLENILEELVGQIQDEFDQEKPLWVKTDVQTWEIEGTLPLHELADLINEPMSAEGISTVSGWVTQRLGGFPREDNVVPVGRYELRVLEADATRVVRLKVSRISEASATPESGNAS
ncbi:MAG: hemolysin family protein [Verrucomicrobiota bacterium]